MIKRVSLLVCLWAVASAQTCNITITPGANSALSDADAEIVISRDADEDAAKVTAELSRGFTSVRLEDNQKIEVNDVLLAGTRGTFHATVDAAASYTIAVTDPRRGADETTIAEPAEFNITSPMPGEDASLSGFTVTWSPSSTELEVEISLSQNLLGDKISLKLDRITDTGSAVIASRELADAGFGQGADLTIAVTRIQTEDNVRGFRDGQAECRLTVISVVNPTP